MSVYDLIVQSVTLLCLFILNCGLFLHFIQFHINGASFFFCFCHCNTCCFSVRDQASMNKGLTGVPSTSPFPVLSEIYLNVNPPPPPKWKPCLLKHIRAGFTIQGGTFCIVSQVLWSFKQIHCRSPRGGYHRAPSAAP